jgi:transaldolase / glucose-6-phosphate isomerase
MLAQRMFPGFLAEAYSSRLQNFSAAEAVSRLWRKDATLWPAEKHELPTIQSNLAFLDLPELLSAHLETVLDRMRSAQREGLDHFVFVSMGSSNLATACVMRLVGQRSDLQSFLVDTTDPDALMRLSAAVPLARTLFVFTSKSGKRLETHALLLLFLSMLKEAGIRNPGRHFVASTEPDSYLSTLAAEYKFRDVFLDPPGIYGWFSGLIHFALLLITIGGCPPQMVMSSVATMGTACRIADPLLDNPAASLAALLTVSQEAGLTRVVLITDDDLSYFSYCIAQLLCNSLTGDNRGFVPIFGKRNYPMEILERNCLWVDMKLKAQSKNGGKSPLIQQLREQNLPVAEMIIESPADLAAEVFKWGIAAALTGAALQRNPFRTADSAISLRTVSTVLQKISGKRDSRAEPRLQEDGLALYIEGQTRRMISGLGIRNALRSFLQLRKRDSYVAMCPFFEITEDYLQTLDALRDRMEEALGVPVQLVSGPRYLYALGKLFKEGPPGGIFLIVTAKPANDIPVPGAGYTFGDLQSAFAIAEFQTLEILQKPVIRVDLTEGAQKGLKQFSDVVIQAMAQFTGV